MRLSPTQLFLVLIFIADVIYVDFADHVEKRVPRLKAFFEYLVDKAIWHRPSVLVIDNMDALLEAEKEAAKIVQQARQCVSYANHAAQI